MAGSKVKIGGHKVSVRVTRPHLLQFRMTKEEFKRLQLFSSLSCSASDFVRASINFYMGYLEGCNDTVELQELQAGLADIQSEANKERKAQLAERKAKMLEKEIINKRKFWALQHTKNGTRVNPPNFNLSGKKMGRPPGRKRK